MRTSPTVAVLIVTTAKGMKYLPQLLPSVSRQTYKDRETTVVVDGGDPSIVNYLRSGWPEVQIVTTKDARGFARAAQRGIDESSGEYIALLNDDIELEPDWIQILVDELDQDPGIGFVTGKTLLFEQRDVINETSQDLHTCGRFVPRGSEEKDVGQYDAAGPTTVASSSASVYRRAAVERAGGFDLDYGMYCDESDLCLRMILSGYRGWYLPDARAYHAWSWTTGRASDTSVFLGNRNSLITLAKDFPGPLLLRSLPKIVRYQWYSYKLARANHWARILLKAWTSFLRMLPATLRKRHEVQKKRKIAAREFEAHLLTDYPDLPPVVRDPEEMRRFEPARLRLVALDLARRVRR
jgi:GT2 family glycosyltransferase